MKPLVTAALLVVSLMSVPPVSADVIELRTGERVEGTFKGADDSAVRIEIDGRIVTFAPAQVRAIYYGSAPTSTTPAPLLERDEAIGALEGLRSVARTGLTYREYAPRVSEAQIIVDQYLKKEDGAPAIKGAIADSFHFYALAGAAWNAGLNRGELCDRRYGHGSGPMRARSTGHRRVQAEESLHVAGQGRRGGATTGMVIAADGLASRSCASDKLAEAEKLRVAR